MMGKELPWKRNGLPPMVNTMRLALAKSRRVREASHQPAFMDSCLTIAHMCLPCLPCGRRASSRVLWPLVIGLMVAVLTFFSDGAYGFTYGELMLF